MSTAAKYQAMDKIVTADDDGLRIDRWFRNNFPGLSQGAIEKMLRKGEIRIDGGRAKSNRRITKGEVIRIPPTAQSAVQGSNPKTANHGLSPEKRKADKAYIEDISIYQDADILALNKPFGLPVQGGTGATRHIDGLTASLEKNGERPRLVHRLDRDTGGLLILAKTRRAAAALSGALQRHEITKTYWALTAMAPTVRQGRIDLPIGKRIVSTQDGEQERVESHTNEGAKKALTDFQVVDAAGTGPAFLALRPITGRTHQLRVHCAAIEAPIVGDGKYGGKAAKIEGLPRKLHLFCREMSFVHPSTNRKMTLRAPLCGHMQETWNFLSFDQEAQPDWPDELD